ncbi:excinuclease ABC subunit UvrA [Adhaeretor mobilis]|uniref:UvrABC system protein A n=1 Tax=Adhaeretor mobilis TaxID=1930276 RepID=A0A517MT63_9BACT|nr:excinuclease ABC subunit UvrA [Adhaeretor mobilis]QDS98080.1 UvrABC system protein A [Adhaeretor mobilis]
MSTATPDQSLDSVARSEPAATDEIRLRGVEVHNLRHVDLDLPHRKLIAFCGVSGSGKSSLALDTLYAEGQRRYIESFSAYTRQFLEQLDKPEAESIEGIPPSIAVTRKSVSRSSRATVGSATQINEHLQLLFARIGEIVCYQCHQKVESTSADLAAQSLTSLPDGTRAMVGFISQRGTERNNEEWLTDLISLGYRRVVLEDQLGELSTSLANQLGDATSLEIVVDRITAGSQTHDRLHDSLESAMEAGRGIAVVWSQVEGHKNLSGQDEENDEEYSGKRVVELAGATWQRHVFSRRLRCETCEIDYPDLQPQLFNYNNPLGACPECEGFGNVTELDMSLVVPDPSKSLRDGAIAPWNTPSYKHELEELIALADDYDLPLDVPFAELLPKHLELIHQGVPERDFGGLRGFVAWLERRKYKMHIRVFLSRWRSYYPCTKCDGARLNPAALAVKIAGKSLAEVVDMPVEVSRRWMETAALKEAQRAVGRLLLSQVGDRLAYLDKIGLGHLSLSRPLRSLSGGEAQRVALTSALGSNLTGMLYVLDEPSAGLHAADLPRLVDAVAALRDRGNTVALVEHNVTLIQSADEVVELGPGAGEFGGKVIYQGEPDGLVNTPESRLGDWLTGRRYLRLPAQRRATNQGWLKLSGARGNNLQNITVDFPLGMLCAVTGVSGAGKSTLVGSTLYPALAVALQIDAGKSDVRRPADFDDLVGVSQIDDCILVDQTPIGRTPRSNPITYVKAFDPIRTLFAATTDAKAAGFKAGHFSFNVDGGRCPTCQGDGHTQVDMQLMADVFMRCADCQGQRYRREVLEVKYRGLSIADVLDLSVREAFTFFRGQKKILTRLKCLIDVGLDYLRLGQAANTLSGGEAQRLKLANYVSAAKRGRTLFIMDEPTAGLHNSDVMQLLDCFQSLTDMGHSLIVVEHHMLVMQAADYLIDMGPGAAEEGGQIVATGPPEDLARQENSITARYLAAALKQTAEAAEQAAAEDAREAAEAAEGDDE